jgi:SET domain-containing protein
MFEYLGRGVFTKNEISRGDFLLEYRGELINEEEGQKRERNYDEEFGSFMYFFQYMGKKLW